MRRPARFTVVLAVWKPGNLASISTVPGVRESCSGATAVPAGLPFTRTAAPDGKVVIARVPCGGGGGGGGGPGWRVATRMSNNTDEAGECAAAPQLRAGLDQRKASLPDRGGTHRGGCSFGWRSFCRNYLGRGRDLRFLQHRNRGLLRDSPNCFRRGEQVRINAGQHARVHPNGRSRSAGWALPRGPVHPDEACLASSSSCRLTSSSAFFNEAWSWTRRASPGKVCSPCSTAATAARRSAWDCKLPHFGNAVIHRRLTTMILKQTQETLGFTVFGFDFQRAAAKAAPLRPDPYR